MENKQPSLLAQWKKRSVNTDTSSKIHPIPNNTPIPLSQEQKRLWFLQQLNPNNPFYNYSELYEFHGNLEVSLFEKSIRLIETNHDILKSNFKIVNGNFIAEVNTESKSDYSFFDFSELEKKQAQKKANDLIFENSRTIFDLSNDILFKSVLIKISENHFLFSITLHHIITDEWAMRIFREELTTYYKALKAKQEIVINKQALQYGSYAYWQQNKKPNRNHIEYWKKTLSGEIPVLNLPFDHPRKPQPSYKGTFHTKVYNKQTSQGFFDLCKELEATPYVLMLSIYYILLYKYSGQSDILVGTSITKRNEKALEKLMGFFNDTLVLRTPINPNTSFNDFIKVVKKTYLKAFSNTDISFDTLVKELNPDRSLSVNPFFQTMFLYNNSETPPTLSDDISYSHEVYDMGGAKFDLTFQVSDEGGILKSLFVYAIDLFDIQTIDQMHLHFEILLNEIIKNPSASISEIEIITEKEKNFFNAIENPNILIEKKHQGIHQFISYWGEAKKDATAIIYGNQKISYSQLDIQSSKIAAQLQQQGVQKNDIIGLSVKRSPKMIIGLLGILKAGAAYLPLDPEYPEDRTAYILANSNSKILITEDQLLETFNKISIPLNSIDTILNQNSSLKHNPVAIEENDLAYVIYTSGSTGKPKGVAISHKNIINSTLARSTFYENNPAAFLLMSSISFDSSKAGVFWTLCFGGKLIISENRLEQDLSKLVNTIKKHNVTHTLMLPSLYQTVVKYGDINASTSLKTVIVAGEACPTSLAKSHFKKLPNTNLYNEYGPTEGTVWCLAHKISREDVYKNTIPVGKPVANTSIYILDNALKKVPYGTIGELYIGGENVSPGYLNDNEKTKANFIKLPYYSNENLYKTGDLVKLNNEGEIIFLGRIDQQVKIRGYRIELDEIEKQLNEHPNIESAVVVIEANESPINWEDMAASNNLELEKILNENFNAEEVDQLITSVNELEESEIELLLKNL